jgi:hypothetical protein
MKYKDCKQCPFYIVGLNTVEYCYYGKIAKRLTVNNLIVQGCPKNETI